MTAMPSERIPMGSVVWKRHSTTPPDERTVVAGDDLIRLCPRRSSPTPSVKRPGIWPGLFSSYSSVQSRRKSGKTRHACPAKAGKAGRPPAVGGAPDRHLADLPGLLIRIRQRKRRSPQRQDWLAGAPFEPLHGGAD